MRKLRAWVATGVILCVPFLLVRFQNSYFPGDVMKFSQWSVAWNLSSLSDLYRVCGTCNYPITGTAVSGGVLAVLRNAAPDSPAAEIHQRYRYFLATVDAGAGLATALLLGLLGVGAPLALAAGFTLLPSSWAGTAVWGQIEGVTQLLLLLAAIGMIALLRSNPLDGPGFKKWIVGFAYAAAGCALVSALFAKQLAIFSLPALALLWVLASARLWQAGFPRTVLAVSPGLALAFLRVDLSFQLPGDWNSHLAYILFGGGSDHGYKIAGNGFNLWVLLGRPQESSSDAAFLGPLTPRGVGLVLFLGFNALLYGSLWTKARANWRQWIRPETDARYPGALLLFAMGLSHLSFNVFMTGTHERHLYHFFPFVLIALFFFRSSGVPTVLRIVPVALAAVAYGFFVYFTLPGVEGTALTSPAFLALSFLALLIYLCEFWLRILRRDTGRNPA